MDDAVAHGDVGSEDLSAASAGDVVRARRVAREREGTARGCDSGEPIADLGRVSERAVQDLG